MSFMQPFFWNNARQGSQPVSVVFRDPDRVIYSRKTVHEQR
jgi:hypothetical protein